LGVVGMSVFAVLGGLVRLNVFRYWFDLGQYVEYENTKTFFILCMYTTLQNPHTETPTTNFNKELEKLTHWQQGPKHRKKCQQKNENRLWIMKRCHECMY
jgi:hypothetical protein